MKFGRIIIFGFIFVMLFAACNPSEAEVDTPVPPTETSSPTLTDTLAPTHTLTNSPTASQTSTVTPSHTATSTSTSTATPSPADIVVFIIKTDWLGLRSGPGIHYDLLGLYFEGAEAIVLGTDPARQWFFVQVVEDGAEGWFFGEFLTLDPSDLEFIPVVDATPTPPPVDLKPNLTATQECKWLENKGTPCP